jgi:hypothetical protein
MSRGEQPAVSILPPPERKTIPVLVTVIPQPEQKPIAVRVRIVCAHCKMTEVEVTQMVKDNERLRKQLKAARATIRDLRAAGLGRRDG